MILVVATSRKTRGGITAVVASYERNDIWQNWKCKWIESQRDKSYLFKLYYFLTGLLKYVLYLPFAKIVHIHLSEPVSASRKLIFQVIAQLLRKPVILHFHSFSPESTINSRFKPLYKWMFSHATIVIVLSEFWRNAVTQSFGNSIRCKIIPNPCITVNTLKPRKRIEQRPYILFAGTLNERKGYSVLISAFSKIAARNPEWKLVFAGNGEIEKAQKQVQLLGLNDQISFLGWVAGDAKATAFQNASIFCLPSFAEGFPMAVLDAFAYGIPVITTPVGGILDYVEHRVNASVVPCGNDELLAVELQYLISNQDIRSRYSEESTKLAKTVFAEPIICKNLELLYSEICK